MAETVDGVEVRLGAQTDPLQAGFAAAAASVDSASASMKAALGGTAAASKAAAGGIAADSAKVGASFGAMAASAKASLSETGAAIGGLHAKFLAFAAVIAGGGIIGEALSSLFKLESEVRTLENVMAMGSAQATQYAVALGIMGKSADDYTQLSLRMARNMKMNEADMNALGIKTRDTSGAFLPLNTVMENGFTAMQQYKAGTDQAEFALRTFGRSVGEVYDYMVTLPAALERAKVLIHDFGIEMGPERQAEIRAYKIELGATKEAFAAIGEKIGEALMPQLGGLARWMAEDGPTAAVAFVNAIKGFIIVVDVLVAAFKIAAIAVGSFIKVLAVNVDTAWKLIVATTTGNWGRIPGIIEYNTKRAIEITKQGAKDIVAVWDGAGKTIAGLLADNATGKAGPGPLKSGSKNVPDKAKPGGTDRMAEWNEQLAAQKDAYEQMKLEQGSFEQWSVADTINYWLQILARGDLSDKERIAANRAYYTAARELRVTAFNDEIAGLDKQMSAYRYASQARVDIAMQEWELVKQRYGNESKEAEAAWKKVVTERQKMADQIKAIDDALEKAQQARLDHEIKMDELAEAQDVALRKISTDQKLALDVDYENRRYAAALDAAKKIAALETDPAKLVADLAKIEAIEAAHQEKLTQIQNAAVLEREQFVLAAQSAVQSSFATLMDDLISHTKTLKQSLLDFANSIASALNKVASQDIAKMLFGPGTQGNSIIGQLFGAGTTAAGAGESAASAGLVTAGTDLIAAATALQTAAASLAGGGIGGALGGGGGGFDFGMLSGLIPTFATGSPYVPQTTLALVHKGEAIIPSAFNKGPGGGGVNLTNNFLLQGAIDGRTQDQIAAKSARAVQRATSRNT